MAIQRHQTHAIVRMRISPIMGLQLYVSVCRVASEASQNEDKPDYGIATVRVEQSCSTSRRQNEDKPDYGIATIGSSSENWRVWSVRMRISPIMGLQLAYPATCQDKPTASE